MWTYLETVRALLLLCLFAITVYRFPPSDFGIVAPVEVHISQASNNSESCNCSYAMEKIPLEASVVNTLHTKDTYQLSWFSCLLLLLSTPMITSVYLEPSHSIARSTLFSLRVQRTLWVLQFHPMLAAVSALTITRLGNQVSASLPSLEEDVLGFTPASFLNCTTSDVNPNLNRGSYLREVPSFSTSRLLREQLLKDTVNAISKPPYLSYDGERTWYQTRTSERPSAPGRRRNYRPRLWTSLKVDNCYQKTPEDLLSSKDIDLYERIVYKFPIQDNSLENSIRRRQVRKPYPIPSAVHTWNNEVKRKQDFRSSVDKMDEYHPHRSFPSPYYPANTLTYYRPIKHSKTMSDTKPSRTLSRPHSSWLLPKIASVKMDQASRSDDSSQTVITVHKILIRPSFIEINRGGVNARLRYVIQLHKKITGFYRLTIEARINPEYPPIYVGTMQNVCAHWPADVPHSKCSLSRSRLYQKGQVCFCSMPPGIYLQRLRLNLSDILNGIEVPRFLVNFLFQGKTLNVHLKLKLEREDNVVAGCVNLNVPVLLNSA